MNINSNILKMAYIILFANVLLSCTNNKQIAPPKPYGVVPSERQLQWHNLEMYAFLHFTTNTFTDKEWGFGDESPDVFNPTDFDAEQIIGTLSKATTLCT